MMEDSWEDLLCRVYRAGYEDCQHERDYDPMGDKVVDAARVRAKKMEQRIRELEAALSELFAWAEEIAGDCDDPVQSQQEDEMMDRINKVLMMDRINRVLMMDRINRVLEPPR